MIISFPSVLVLMFIPFEFRKVKCFFLKVRAIRLFYRKFSHPLYQKLFFLHKLVFIPVLVLLLVQMGSVNSIRSKETFDIFKKDNREYAIVRIYGDRVVAKEIKNESFQDGVYLFNLDDLSMVKISKKKIESKKYKEINPLNFIKLMR